MKIEHEAEYLAGDTKTGVNDNKHIQPSELWRTADEMDGEGRSMDELDAFIVKTKRTTNMKRMKSSCFRIRLGKSFLYPIFLRSPTDIIISCLSPPSLQAVDADTP